MALKLLTYTLHEFQKIFDTLKKSINGELRVPNQTVISAPLPIPKMEDANTKKFVE